MREALARMLALATGLVVLATAMAFGWYQNPGSGEAIAAEPRPASATEPASSADRSLETRGREVYVDAGCAGCHAIGGEGNPRNPLDGVGSRLSPDEIRHFTVADPAVAEDLAPRVVAAKRKFAKMPAEDLDALVAFLSSLK